MYSVKNRLFIPSGLSIGLLVLALGVLQGAMSLIVAGLAILAGPALFWISDPSTGSGRRFGFRQHSEFRNPNSTIRNRPTVGRTGRYPRW
ncbi:MAG: hypothetical protein ACE5LU_01500 [Anaerolineae bacterium]